MKLLLTVFLLACTLPFTNADAYALFSYDRAAVDQSMQPLTRVEEYVASHQGVTLEQLQSENNTVINGISLSNKLTNAQLIDGPIGIPSFLWGCILGWIGILIVYLVTEDTEETKKALWGCITSAVTGCLVYVIFWALVWGGAFGSMYWY